MSKSQFQAQGDGQRNNFERNHSHNRSNSKNFNRRQSNNNNGNGYINHDLIHDEAFQRSQEDRLMYLIFNSINANVVALTNSGTKLQGVLESIDPKTLRLVLKTDDSKLMSVNYDDLIDFEVQNVDLFNNSILKPAQGGFKTDTDISTERPASSSGRRQEMERWVPDDATVGVSLGDLSLEDNSSTRWDQFQTNESKFGIKSEFDENLYTTKINKNDPNYHQKLQRAEQLAKEIEGQGFNGNYHLAEERGVKFDDSGIDEEDKYSGVTRNKINITAASNDSTAKGDALFASLINKDSKNVSYDASDSKTKYVPPAQRSRIQNQDPSIISASNIPSSKQTPAAASQPSQKPSKPELKQTPTPATIPSKPSTIPAKPIQSSQYDKKKSSEQLKKISTLNEINSLKEFSQNFKLPSKFPTDLLPIITKDKQKQEEIIKKSETTEKPSSPATSKSPVVAPSSVPSPIPPKPQQTQQQSKPPAPTKEVKPSSNTPITSTQKKVEPTVVPSNAPPQKHNFKLNPKAASFTPFSPSAGQSPMSSVASPVFSKNSPRLQTPNFKKKYPSVVFFAPDKAPSPDKKKSFGDDFNFFKGRVREFEARHSEEKFFLEKPFTTPPTWTRDDVEKSYKSLFPDPSTIKYPRFTPPVLPQPMQQFQPMPMMNPPQMFYPPQQFMPMQLSPQQAATQISPSESPNFYQQRLQPMYPQGGMAPAQMGYQRFPQGYPQPGPMPMMPPNSGRMQGGIYKNH